MHLPAIIALLVLAAAAGCGGDDDNPEPARPTATIETVTQPPEPPAAQPAVPPAEQKKAIALVSRYADVLQRKDLGRACSLVSPPARAGCVPKLERFVDGNEVLRLTRTVPIWEKGSVDSGTGVIDARVKVGFPEAPRQRWTFHVVKEESRPWRISAPLPDTTGGG